MLKVTLTGHAQNCSTDIFTRKNNNRHLLHAWLDNNYSSPVMYIVYIHIAKRRKVKSDKTKVFYNMLLPRGHHRYCSNGELFSKSDHFVL